MLFNPVTTLPCCRPAAPGFGGRPAVRRRRLATPQQRAEPLLRAAGIGSDDAALQLPDADSQPRAWQALQALKALLPGLTDQHMSSWPPKLLRKLCADPARAAMQLGALRRMRRDIPVIACVLRCPELLTEEGLEHTLPHPTPIKHMSLHPHGHSVLSLDAEGRLGLWDLVKRPPAFTLLDSGYTDALDAVAFHPDGRQFAVLGEGVDGLPYLALCDLQPALGAGVAGGSAVLLAKCTFPTGRLASDPRLTFTADGGTVLVSVVRTLGPHDPQRLQAPVDVWGVALGAEEPLTLKGQLGVRGNRTDALAVSPYGSEALFSEGEVAVRLDLEGRRELGRLQQGAEVSCIAVNCWGWALVGDSSGGIKLWDGGRGPSFPLISAVSQAHAGAVTCSAATADGWLVITGGCDGWIRVWRLPDLVCVANVAALHAGQAVRHLSVAPDGLLLVLGGDDGMLRIEDLTQLQAQMTLTRGGRA